MPHCVLSEPGHRLTRYCRSGSMVSMRTLQGSIISWGRFGLIATLLTACATAGDPLTSHTEFDTMVPGWEYKYALDWKVQPAQDGTSLVYGRVSSKYGEFAGSFRVLGMAVDSSGKVIGQRIGLVPGGVPGFASVYFEVGPLPAAASYRVTVWDYDTLYGRRKVN